MRILIVSTFFPPLNSIASLRPYSWAKQWSSQGHDITILTTKKNQDPAVANDAEAHKMTLIEVAPQGKLNQIKKKVKVSKSASPLRNMFEWLRNRYGIYNSCRMPDLTDQWVRPAIKKALKQDPWDVIVSTAGPYTTHIVANVLKKKGKAKFWVADYRDPWSDSFIYSGIFPLNLFEKCLERYLMRKADLITTVSNPFKEKYQKKYGAYKAHTFTNGFDPVDLQSIERKFAFKCNTKYRIVHAGSIYADKRDPSPLFRAIAELAQDTSKSKLLDNLEVLFIGSNQANLQKLIEKYQVDRWVKQGGFVSRNESLAMQRDAHALLFLPWNDKKVDGILTGKLFEYLYSKTPIIAVGCDRIEASQRIILESNAGYAFTSTSQIKFFLTEELNNIQKKQSSVPESILLKYDRKTIANNLMNLIKNRIS